MLLRCGLARHDPEIAIETATVIRIDGGSETPIHTDGELFADAQPVEIGQHPDRPSVIMAEA